MDIYVYIDAFNLMDTPLQMGVLHVENIRGKEIFSFHANKQWIENLTPKGWQLSPVYDLTPNPNGIGLKLNVNETDNSLDFNLAISTAPYYGINLDEAKKLVNQVKEICAMWKQKADNIGIPKTEQNLMSSVFSYLSNSHLF